MLDFMDKLMRMFFTFLDRIVYGVISMLYELLLYLANLDLFGMSSVGTTTTASENIIVNFSSRVYALLGIFMLFRISFSILQYMVNPDAFSDKAKGFGKLITNVLVSLVLIVTVPIIFQKAMEVQGIILEENVLGQLILGQSNDSKNNGEESSNYQLAEDMKFLVYASFFTVNENAGLGCSNNPVLGTVAMASDEACLKALGENEDIGDKLLDFFPTDGINSRNFDAFGDVVNAKQDDVYVFNYMPLVTTLAGGFIAWVMLGFCLDVAVRIIKLGFLEIIAPIPIISYMDPTQSKDGMFSKWAKECGSTYLSLFIRLAVIYFVFYVIGLITGDILAGKDNAKYYLNGDVPVGAMSCIVWVMVILGLLIFAKQVPQLLENVFGIKASGNLTFNPLKRINESPLAIGAIGAIGGAGISTVASGFAAAKTSLANGESLGTVVKRGFGGAVGGFGRGIKTGVTAKSLGDIGRRSITNAGVAASNASIARGTTARGRAAARFINNFGIPSRKERMDANIEQHEALSKAIKARDEHVESELNKKSSDWQHIQSERKRMQKMYNDGQITWDTLNKFNTAVREDEKKLKKQYIQFGGVTDGNGNVIEKDLSLANYNKDIWTGIENLGDKQKDGSITINNVKDTNGNPMKLTRDMIDSDLGTSKELKDQIDNNVASIKSSDDYQDASRYDKVVKQQSMQSHVNRK